MRSVLEKLRLDPSASGELISEFKMIEDVVRQVSDINRNEEGQI